jgi:hypothetical protein
MGQTYECRVQSHGALLYLPHGARSEDVIHTKPFEDYISDNVDNWLRWAKKKGLPVENMEDLILVTGCTLATSWAAAAFDGTMSRDVVSTIFLEARKSDGGGAQFVWRNIRGSVEYHHHSKSVCSPAYLFFAVNLKIFYHARLKRISVSLSGASEQSATSFGSS